MPCSNCPTARLPPGRVGGLGTEHKKASPFTSSNTNIITALRFTRFSLNSYENRGVNLPHPVDEEVEKLLLTKKVAYPTRAAVRLVPDVPDVRTIFPLSPGVKTGWNS